MWTESASGSPPGAAYLKSLVPGHPIVFVLPWETPNRGRPQVIRIYCFVLLRHPTRKARCWRGREASLVFFRDVAAVIENGLSEVSASNVTLALFHHRVVSKAVQQFAAVLPCRAGTQLANGSAVRSWLREKYRRLKEHLSRLAGRQEVGVKLILPTSTLLVSRAASRGQGSLSGQEYLRQKLAERHRTQHFLELLREELERRKGMQWEDRRCEVRFEHGRVVLNLCYLTRGATVPEFRAACRLLRRRNPHLQLWCTGPWPPYSFAQPL